MDWQEGLKSRVWWFWRNITQWARPAGRFFAQAGRVHEDRFLAAEHVEYFLTGPEGHLQRSAKTGSPLPIQLSLHSLDQVVRELAPFLGGNCPIYLIYDEHAQVEQPAEVVQATLATIRSLPSYGAHIRSAFILVG